MILTALLALAPVALAIPNAHDIIGTHHKRTGPPAGTSVVPTVSCGNKKFYARGCYDELKSGLMALNHDISSTLSSITVENCVQGCSAAGYSIAGVMNGNQCLCDNAMSANAPKLDDTQCDLTCSGNSAEVCGGVWHYEIYYTSPTATIPAPAAPTTVGSGSGTYNLIGCYNDVIANRTLPDWMTDLDNNTPAACAATCFAEGYPLAGVEWGKECYCGKTLINPDLTALTDCGQACAGDSTQTCGGEGTINVYTQQTEPPSTPSNPPKPQPTCGNNDHERYLHQGCYNDNDRRRTLNEYSFTSNSMTPTTCSSKCFSKGYSYAGIENGNTCYCGNTCPRQKTNLRNCNKTCGGDRHHIGGGSQGTLTIYKSFTLGYPQKCWPGRSFSRWV